MCEEFGITEELYRDIQDCFDIYDQDGDGSVSVKELPKMIRALGANPSPEEIEDMLEEFDSNETMEIDEFTYIAAHHLRACDAETELVNSFRIFDRDNTGKISVDMVKKILKNISVPLTDEQIEKLLRKTGTESDMVDYRKLAEVMLTP